MKKLILATLLTVAAFSVAVQPTFANEETAAEQAQKQRLEQELEIKCETGAYGQTTTCYAKGKQVGEQEQRQKILAAQIGGRKVHVPVDTAIDMTTLMVVMTAAVAGFGATYALAKLK
jgi:hypothetical protein